MAVEASIADKLTMLWNLQLNDSQLDEIQILKGELPMEVSDLEDEVAGLDTRIKKMKAVLKEGEQEISKMQTSSKEADANIKRYQKQLDEVKNNREYEALQKEIELAKLDGVHALTDITGFGLAGHGLELARGANLKMQVRLADIPLLAGVLEFAAAGVVTGASGRNWASYGAEVELPQGISAAYQALLCDPQTSGGLLVACSAESEEAVLACFEREGFAQARTIGTMTQGSGFQVI